MSEPYTPPSAYTSDTTSCHDSDESEEFFLEDQLPTKSRDPSNPSNTSTVTPNKRDAAPVPDNASRAPFGSSPIMVPNNASNLLQAIKGLQESITNVSEQFTAPTPSQEVQQRTQSMSITKCPATAEDSIEPISLFDPTGLVEKKFFAGAPDAICAYLTRHFSKPLNSEHRIEMAKKYKRPDIPAMRVHKLDTYFHKRDYGFVKGRDETLRDIQRTTLHSVGPLCELITKIYQGQIISQDQIVEYASATLVLLGSTTANIVLARRKNAIRAVNSALVNEVESLPHDDQTSLVFGPDNLKTLIDAQKERSTFEKLAAERPAKRQKTNQRPYYNPRENTTYRPNQFFRGGSTGGTGFSGADQRKPRPSYSRRPYRGNTTGHYRH